ncbi:prolipoprotein diacylglycerol transferase [Erythrobacter litoralis HTCC2594]|uniref:Phosphatidylglycerol--prolipoprotein diacylglyceryl transferase n=1 Tax=Erythrobacter litoralis (strain HTCC2594) TaxID=314225 RepID=LGT_ERYLH|nr:RecName: Full=Phosphatidylglycerol--prolipoprotein diacylglyceryl transferase [Erythrobacter litoralis HTCC2594]ABC64455.1 prolipoprotein diacylglycerol transferase [Erythrobacter litoralis HTCC2594]
MADAASQPIYWSELGLSPGIDLGFFTLRFYSLAYIVGIVLAYWHLGKMIKAPGAPMAQSHADDLFFYCTLGVIFGGRIGYVLFYRPDLLGTLDMFKVWEGGMSFHGGVIGVVLAILFVSWRGKLNWLRVCDYIAVNVPFGMFLGRMANFVNGELYGRPTDVSWAMIFPTDPDQVARHPSQLYQAGLEGLLMMAVMLLLFWQTRARWRPGVLVGVFTIGIAGARFVNEFFRAPDAHLADVVRDTGLSQGQWLSIPMILVGLAVVVYALTRKTKGTPEKPASA